MPAAGMPVDRPDPLGPPLQGDSWAFEVEGIVALAALEDLLHVLLAALWLLPQVLAELGVEGLEEGVLPSRLAPEVRGPP